MELIAKGDYHSGLCSLYAGMSTDQFSLPEEVKAQMLADHPDLFEVVGAASTSPAQADESEEEEDNKESGDEGVEVTHQEAKMPKMRKK